MTTDDPLRVDPTRPAGRFARAYAAIAATRVAGFISRHLNWKLDPFLLRVTGGRFATTLVFPTALLETTGARSGITRRNAIIYFHDGDTVVIVASNAGSPQHPAWFHNLCAHPEVTLGGRPMRAAVITNEAERDRLWPLADNVFPAYVNYRRAAISSARTIPMIALIRYNRTEGASTSRIEHVASGEDREMTANKDERTAVEVVVAYCDAWWPVTRRPCWLCTTRT